MPKLTDKVRPLNEELRRELGEDYKKKLKDKDSKESLDLVKMAEKIRDSRLFRYLYKKGEGKDG